jgi:hypothetical protein
MFDEHSNSCGDIDADSPQQHIDLPIKPSDFAIEQLNVRFCCDIFTERGIDRVGSSVGRFLAETALIMQGAGEFQSVDEGHLVSFIRLSARDSDARNPCLSSKYRAKAIELSMTRLTDALR